MTLSVAQADQILKQQLGERPGLSLQGTSKLPRQITICGGGNGAHVSAGYLASKGIRVNVLTRRPQEWAEKITITTAGSSWEAKGTFVGPLNKVGKKTAQEGGGGRVLWSMHALTHPCLGT